MEVEVTDQGNAERMASGKGAVALKAHENVSANGRWRKVEASE